MPVITVVLDQENVDRAEQIAAELSELYGVKVSRASVIRRAIMAYQPRDLQAELNGLVAQKAREEGLTNDHE